MMNIFFSKYNRLLTGLLGILLLASCNNRDTLFQQLPSAETGVTFSNRVEETESRNILTFPNIYNGGGVAVADFNNDGLQDLYFSANTGDNELYLNQGNFKFKNITEVAGVAGKDRWSSGVAVVDINNDGLTDLYICATTYEEADRRANLFYINQGTNEENIPVFEEKAAEFNLADTTHTTMAAFFDYDNDSDLDLYLLVNKFNSRSSMDHYHEKLVHGESVTTDRLYRNEGPDPSGQIRFTDVSEEAGILIEGFGLGVNIADFNRDGWKDIYVANDFIANEILYVSNGDGTFTDKAGTYFKHTAHASMGNDVADVNNDGHIDVLMVDMLPEDNYRKKKMLQPNNYMNYVNNEKFNYDYQYVRNQLQVYRGNSPESGDPVYSDLGIFANIAATDWSWAPLIMDFDNDGWRDIFITNGFPRDITDHDFEDQANRYRSYVTMEKLLDMIPSIKISNYAFKNNGDLTFKNVSGVWGLDKPSFSYGAAQVDLNNDGFLDLVVNNINDSAFVYRNNQPELNPEKNNYLRVNFEGPEQNRMGLGALVEIEYDNGQKQFYEHTLYRGYLSSVEPIAHFGLGDHDLVERLTVLWPDNSVQELSNVEANQVLTLYFKDADAGDSLNFEPDTSSLNQLFSGDISDELNIDYRHRERDFNDFNVQPLLPHKLSQYGPSLSVGDANSDGLKDIYISGAFEYKGGFLIQQPDGTFNNVDLLEGNNPENREEEMGSLFFDADGDGDDDLYIVSGSYEHEFGDRAYQDRFFINEDGTFRLDENALPGYFLASGSAVRAADFDRDGDLDLFVGGRVKPHEYPKPVDSYILENVSEGGEVQFKIANNLAPVLEEIGMVSDALWTDFNNDGWMDLVLAGEWMSLKFLENNSGSFVDITDKTGIAGHAGWWNSLCGGDFDSDGDTDYIAGNLGTNTFNQANEEYPVRIYANDFDKNGTYDAIPTVYYQNRSGEKMEVPFHGRIDLIKQMPGIRKIFETYHSIATASIDEILAKFDTTGTLVYSANYMKTSYVENLEDGRFSISPLPDNVQWAPIYGCTTGDLNDDGNLDVVLVGNDYGNEISTGRYDALNGLVLTGEGDGTFNVVEFEESGFFVPGDAKALVSYVNKENELVVAASQNRGPLKMFKKEGVYNRPAISIPVRDNDAYAEIHFEDGTIHKKEFYYGSGFLSQSERYLLAPENYTKIEITNFQGEVRTISSSNLSMK